MDQQFERFQAEVEHARETFDAWIETLYEDQDHSKLRTLALLLQTPQHYHLEPERAIGLYSAIIDACETPDLLLWRKEVYEELADTHCDPRYVALALADCDHRIALGEEDYEERVELLLRLKQYQEALDETENITPQPQSPSLRALAYLGLGDTEAAIRQLNIEIEGHPNPDRNLSNLVLRGLAYDYSNQFALRDNDWNEVTLKLRARGNPNWIGSLVVRHCECQSFRFPLSYLNDNSLDFLEISNTQLLVNQAIILSAWAACDFDSEMQSDSITLRRKAVIQDANYLEGWEILFRLLERGWKYDEAIQFALDRPAADIVGYIYKGCLQSNFSLNDFLDSRFWYLQGRLAYLNNSFEEATSHFEAAPKSLRTVVELAMCASRNNNLDRTNDLLCGLLA